MNSVASIILCAFCVAMFDYEAEHGSAKMSRLERFFWRPIMAGLIWFGLMTGRLAQ